MLQILTRDPSLLVFSSILLLALSGLPGLFLKKAPLGQRLATVSALAASLCAVPSLVYLLINNGKAEYLLSWNLPFGECVLALDPLSSFFLIPIFTIFLCGSIYANGYWPAASHRSTEPTLTFFYGLLCAAMALVVTARNGVLFLMSWEVMALSGFFLLAAEHEKAEVRRAGLVYLIASHLGVAALFVLFSLLRLHTGTFAFPAAGGLHLEVAAASAVFVAALLGFGSKAGIMPLHIWLPSAHANAPSHVSALLSGVMLKMGIYGVLRILSFLPHRPVWWGGALLVAGLASALSGIFAATVQKDIKRALAYSSIENIGIIVAAVGVGLIGDSIGDPALLLLGMGAALLHVFNHSLFKPLLFFCAGSVMHAAGTRDVDRMGGLAKRMPATALAALCGAVAISGLPPFNGFVSEFLLYLGFFRKAVGDAPYLALGAPVLALVGGVAAICFVKLFGATFLGNARSERAACGHEAPATMLLPMAVLALLCFAAGALPQAFLALVMPVVRDVAPSVPAGASVPLQLQWFTGAALALLAVGLVVWFVLKGRATAGGTATSGTWGCGYLRPTARMEYTGSSFSEIIASLSSRMLRTRAQARGVEGYAPQKAQLQYAAEETILDCGIVPAFRVAGIGFSYLRRLQHGHLQLYILYVFVTLFLLMVWVH